MLENLIGKKFGRLTVIEEVDSNIKHRRAWRCKCECGNTKDVIVQTCDLKNGHTQSCGCLQRERTSKSNKKYNRYEFKNDYVIGYTNKGKQFIFDKDDYDKIKNYCWQISKGYVVTRDKGKYISFHVFIMGKKDGFVIDHINQKKNDNRKSNLRYATKSQNGINTKKKIKGVYKGKKRWYARITVNKEIIELGSYKTKEEAMIARQQAEIKYFGEFSPLSKQDLINDIWQIEIIKLED